MSADLHASHFNNFRCYLNIRWDFPRV